jgi:hypothetical protein
VLQLVAEVARGVREGNDRDVQLDSRGASAGAQLSGDRMRLKTALEVIVRAVLREQPASTRVVVDSRHEVRDGQPSVRVTVAPEADLARALASDPGPFDDARGGLGLGLPIARRVVGRHGGQVWSALPDEGVELPLGSRGAIVTSLPLSE